MDISPPNKKDSMPDGVNVVQMLATGSLADDHLHDEASYVGKTRVTMFSQARYGLHCKKISVIFTAS